MNSGFGNNLQQPILLYYRVECFRLLGTWKVFKNNKMHYRLSREVVTWDVDCDVSAACCDRCILSLKFFSERLFPQKFVVGNFFVHGVMEARS